MDGPSLESPNFPHFIASKKNLYILPAVTRIRLDSPINLKDLSFSQITFISLGRCYQGQHR